MFLHVRRAVNVRALALALCIGPSFTVAEAASETITPESLGGAIILTEQNQREFYYCFIDIKFFFSADSENCKASRRKLESITAEWKITNLDIRDDKIFLRILTKIFDVYAETFLKRDR